MNISLPKSTFFELPKDIVDKYLGEATGIQLKVILWLFRNSVEADNISKLCSDLKIEKSEAETHIKYWINAGIIQSEDTASEPTPFIPSAKKKETADIPAPSKPSSAEIAQRISESPEIGHLFNESQIKLGKTIGYDGQCTLLLLHDHYGLPVEVLFMLIEYCVSVGKTNYGYIETVGKSWGYDEIDTVQKASEKISILKNADTHWKALAKYAGLVNSRPTAKQSEFIQRWTKDLNMSDDMICRAYDEMATNTGKLNFKYMDKVLLNWFNAGYKTVEDVENGEIKRSEQKIFSASQASASYDINGFEEQSLHSILKYERKTKQ